MDWLEVAQWIIIGMTIGFAIELPVGVLSLWIYDWYLDPYLEEREERRKKRFEKKETGKSAAKTSPQLPEEAKPKLDGKT